MEPGADEAAAPPNLGHVGEVEVEALVLGQFGRVLLLEDVETLGIGLHEPVFDAVVDHLDEMARPGRAGVDVAFLGPVVGQVLAAARPVHVAPAGRQGLEDRVEVVDGLLGAADHHAIAAFKPPNAARGADVHVADALGLQHLGATDVVLVEGIAAVDDDVAAPEQAR